MKNIVFENNKYKFTGFEIIKDEYGFDLRFSSSFIHADKMNICLLSGVVPERIDFKIGENPSYSVEDFIQLFSSRDTSKDDFLSFLIAYNFPPLYKDRKPFIKMDGLFSNSNSQWKIVYPSGVSTYGLLEPVEYLRKGFILYSKTYDKTYGSIGFDVLCVYSIIDEINDKWSKATQQDKYKLLQKLQKAAKNADIEMQEDLEALKIVSPSKIVPKLVEKDGSVQITPELNTDEINQDDFKKHFENRNAAKKIYTLEGKNKESCKVILSDEQEQILTDIKGLEKATNHEIKEFISSPPENWNDENVDISKLYSDRILGWISCSDDSIDFKEFNSKNGWYDNGKTEDLTGNISLAHEEQEKKKKTILDIKDNENDLNYEEEINEEIKNYIVPIIPGGYKKGFFAKKYQNEGIAWMYALYNNKTPGCILADDMGLGKTFQVLSFLQALEDSPKLILIVTPASLVDNWEDEYYHFFSDYKYRIFKKDGNKSFLNNLVESQVENESLTNPTIFITNYENLRASKVYLKIKWDIVILDEAQRIKNPQSLTNRTARGLNTDFRVAITGTPVENTFSDVWAISDFTTPGFLGTHSEFKNKYEIIDTDTDEIIKSKGIELRKKLDITFLRRTKTEMLTDLPPKKYIKLCEQMPLEQKTAYKDVLASSIKHKKLSEKLIILQKLKKTSDHPSLLGGVYEKETYSFEDTAKTIKLKEILLQVKNKSEKVIIFAEYIKTQEILALIILETFGIKPAIYNGSVPMYSRNAILNRFKAVEGFNVIIMSPIAAGVGLTITEANNVIHYSRHWNPAKEDQATDRVYRIGQSKNVYVYNLISLISGIKTFDEKLDALLSRKQDIKGAALFPSNKLNIKESELISTLSVAVDSITC